MSLNCIVHKVDVDVDSLLYSKKEKIRIYEYSSFFVLIKYFDYDRFGTNLIHHAARSLDELLETLYDCKRIKYRIIESSEIILSKCIRSLLISAIMDSLDEDIVDVINEVAEMKSIPINFLEECTNNEKYDKKIKENIAMSKKLNIEDLLRDYTTDELVEFFSQNWSLISGTAEIAKASIMGRNIGKSIASELSGLVLNENSEITYIEPYKDSLIVIQRDSAEYKNALSDLRLILNYNDVYKAVDLLKTRGVCLTGKAGIGKGIIANNIGAEILWDDERYDSYANLVVSCASSINPNNVSWGTGMNNVEVLGAVYTASKYASKHPNTAVVLVLDELFDCDWKSVLGKALEMLSDKTRSTSSVMTNGETIKYESNLFVVVTGNSGEGFTRAIDDERFNTRFVGVSLSGLFDSMDTVKKYVTYMSTLTEDKVKIDTFSKVLVDTFETLSEFDNGKVSKVVSLRALNNLVVTCSNVQEFEDSLHNLFSTTDRKALGWNDNK